MKKLGYSMALMFLLTTGCIGPLYLIPVEWSRYKSLGDVDVSKAGQQFEGEFTCRGALTGIMLVFPEWKDVRVHEPPAGWPLVVRVAIADKDTGRELIVDEFLKEDINFSRLIDGTAVAWVDHRRFDSPVYYRELENGKTYLLRIDVVEPSDDLKECEVRVSWLGWQWLVFGE